MSRRTISHERWQLTTFPKTPIIVNSIVAFWLQKAGHYLIWTLKIHMFTPRVKEEGNPHCPSSNIYMAFFFGSESGKFCVSVLGWRRSRTYLCRRLHILGDLSPADFDSEKEIKTKQEGWFSPH